MAEMQPLSPKDGTNPLGASWSTQSAKAVMVKGEAADVFMIFLRLGCLSFGGPVAHLGYFRAEFVGRRRWLDDTSYAQIVALAQSLPGPASS